MSLNMTVLSWVTDPRKFNGNPNKHSELVQNASFTTFNGKLTRNSADSI